MNDAIYTFIINFDAGDKVGWDYAENTPGLGIIGQVFTPKPLTYKEVEELIKEEKEDFDPKEYYSCYGKFIDYKIITITDGADVNIANDGGYTYDKILKLNKKTKDKSQDNFIELTDPLNILSFDTLPNKIYGISYKSLSNVNDYLDLANSMDHDVEFLLTNKDQSEIIFNKISKEIKKNKLDYDSPNIITSFQLGNYFLLVKIDSGFTELAKYKNKGIYEFISHYNNIKQIQDNKLATIVKML